MKEVAIVMVCICLGIPSVAIAQEYSEAFKFKSAEAKNAVSAYNKAIDDAKKKLQVDLEVAMKTSVEESNVDEAIKLKIALKFLNDGNEPPRKYQILFKKLNGTMWTWQKSFDVTPNLYKSFRNEIVYTYHPKTRKLLSQRTFETTSPLSIRTGDTVWLFNRNLTRYITFSDGTGSVSNSSMRMGVRTKKK